MQHKKRTQHYFFFVVFGKIYLTIYCQSKLYATRAQKETQRITMSCEY